MNAAKYRFIHSICVCDVHELSSLKTGKHRSNEKKWFKILTFVWGFIRSLIHQIWRLWRPFHLYFEAFYVKKPPNSMQDLSHFSIIHTEFFTSNKICVICIATKKPSRWFFETIKNNANTFSLLFTHFVTLFSNKCREKNTIEYMNGNEIGKLGSINKQLTTNDSKCLCQFH